MENLSRMLFNEVLNEKTGGTFKICGTKVNCINGYFVSLRKGFVIPTEFFLNVKYPIVALSYSLEKLFGLNDNIQFDYIGYWVNNGIVYIDCTIHVRTKKEAIKLGRINNQIAIYDCKNNNEIKL
jgi:hypothetical protein